MDNGMKEGCKTCPAAAACRAVNDPVGLALDLARSRASFYTNAELSAVGAPASPRGTGFILPAGFPSPTT